MGGSPICLHRRKSTVIPGSRFRAEPSHILAAGRDIATLSHAVKALILLAFRISAQSRTAQKMGSNPVGAKYSGRNPLVKAWGFSFLKDVITVLLETHQG